MLSYAWEDGNKHYGYAYGVGYWMKHMEFGCEGDVYHFFTAKVDGAKQICSTVPAEFLGEIRLSPEDTKHMKYEMQKRCRAWRLFMASDMPVKKSW